MKDQLQSFIAKPVIARIARFAFFSSVLKMWWGYWLMNPLWNTFATARSYTYLAQITDEFTWGIVFFIVGMLHLFTYWYDIDPFLTYIRTLSFGLWLFIAIGIILSGNYMSTGIPTYSMIAIVELFQILTKGGKIIND